MNSCSDHTSIPSKPEALPAGQREVTHVGEYAQQGLFPRAIQPKLSIGAVDDPLEVEADQMADRVMRMPESSFVQRKCAHCEEEEQVHRKPVKSFLQRKCAECEAEEKLQREPLSPFIHRKESNGKTVATESVASQIQSSKGNGTPLPSPTKTFMESRFGADFSGVRIHTGETASRLSQQVQAKAFTTGSDIYFNAGQFSPHTAKGKHLLAHELTHTLQQAGSSFQAKKIQRKTQAGGAEGGETVVTYKPGKKNPVNDGRISFQYVADKQLPPAQLNVHNHPLMIWAVQHVFTITEDEATEVVGADDLVWGTVTGRTKEYVPGELVRFTLPISVVGKWIGVLSKQGLVDPAVSQLFQEAMELLQNMSNRDYSFFLEWVKDKGIVVSNITDLKNLTPDSLKKIKDLYTEFNANKYANIVKSKEYFLTSDVTRDMRFEDLKDRFFNKPYDQLTAEEKNQILYLFKDKVLSTAFIALEESKIISKQETEKYKQHPELLTEVAQLITGYAPGFWENIEKRLIEFGKFNEAFYDVIQVAPTQLPSPMAASSYSEMQRYYYAYLRDHNLKSVVSLFSNRKKEILSFFSAGNFENILATELATTLSIYAWASKDNLRANYLPEEIDRPLFKQFKQKIPTAGQFDFDKVKRACLEIVLSSYPNIEEINQSDAGALSEMRLIVMNKKHKILSDISVDFRTLATKSVESVKEEITDVLAEKPAKAEKTQARLIEDTDLVWEFQPLLYHVLQQEHLDSSHPVYKVVDAKIKSVANKSFWQSLALGALALVLGLAGIFTGGTTTALGFALLAGSATVGIIDLASQTVEYSIHSDAHAAAFTVPFAEDPSSIGLWLSLIGVVLDVKGLMEVFEQSAKLAGKLAKTGAEASQTADAALKNLAKTKNIDEYADQLYEVLNNRKILKAGITKEAFIKSLKESWQDSRELIENWKKYETVLDKLPAPVKLSIEATGLLKLPVEIRSSLFKLYDFDPQAFNKLMIAVANNPEQLRMLGLQMFHNRTLAGVYGQLSQVLEAGQYQKVVQYFASVGHASADVLPELLHLMNKGNLFSKGDLALQVLTNRKLQQLTLNLSDKPAELLSLWDNFARSGESDFVKFVEKNSPYSSLTKLDESSAAAARIHGAETNKGVLTDMHGKPPTPKSLEGLTEDMEKLGKAVDDPAKIKEVADPMYAAKYDAEVEVEGHTFRRDRETGKWCRFSDEVCNLDTPEAVNAKADEVLGNPDKITPDSVEDITTKIDTSDVSEATPKPGGPGSEEHWKQRWKEYEERMQGNPKKWEFKRWKNVYDRNMERAKKASKAVDAYKARQASVEPWLQNAEREVRVEIEGIERRFDIMETANIPANLRTEGIIHLEELEKAGIKPKVVEHKTGKIYNTQDIQWEVARDEILMKEKGWQVKWVFEGSASAPLKKALKDAGIPFEEIKPPS